MAALDDCFRPKLPVAPVADLAALRALDPSARTYGDAVVVLSPLSVWTWEGAYEAEEDDAAGVVRPASVAADKPGRWAYDPSLTQMALIASQVP